MIPTVLTFSLEDTGFIKNTRLNLLDSTKHLAIKNEFNQAKNTIKLIRMQMLQNLDMAFRSQANETKLNLPSLLR